MVPTEDVLENVQGRSRQHCFLYIPAGPDGILGGKNATQVPRDIRFNMDAGMGNYDSTMR